MKKVKIIILVLIGILLIVGTLSFLKFYNEKKKENNIMGNVLEETMEEYGANVEVYKEPEDVISVIMDGYLGPTDNVEYERTEGDCWYYVDSNAHHYMYCQSNPVIVYIP